MDDLRKRESGDATERRRVSVLDFVLRAGSGFSVLDVDFADNVADMVGPETEVLALCACE